MSEVNCPLRGCDYSGAPSSVEAHISRLTDSSHQGEVGQAWRDALEPGEESADWSFPIGESRRTLVLAGVAVVVLYLLVSRAGSNDQQNDQQNQGTEGDQDQQDELAEAGQEVW